VALVRLPSVLAAEVGGKKTFELEAPTAGAALRALPIANLVFDEHGELRPLVNVYVDGSDVRHGEGLETPLRDDSQVRVVAAIAGG
jgi:sulfur-carrier protein